jgi:RNA ligase
VEFKEFEKIARLNREVVVTEKIDGTNGLVWVSDDSAIVKAGSRSRWITPEADHFGFARWVAENEAELRKLGPGYHYGEWWGSGIQRCYGLAEKRWSLFNVALWGDVRPKCCHVVPVLGSGIGLAGNVVGDALRLLRECGSQAAPGFMKPEGVVIYHTAARTLFKVTLEKDEAPKSRT